MTAHSVRTNPTPSRLIRFFFFVLLHVVSAFAGHQLLIFSPLRGAAPALTSSFHIDPIPFRTQATPCFHVGQFPFSFNLPRGLQYFQVFHTLSLMFLRCCSKCHQQPFGTYPSVSGIYLSIFQHFSLEAVGLCL